VRKWLIRNSNNQIIGPIKEDKLIAMIESGELSKADEVCSGNGYWFKLSEEELVTKYLVKKVRQGFNPISEAVTRSRPLPGELKTEPDSKEGSLSRENINFHLNSNGQPENKSGATLTKKNLSLLIITLIIVVMSILIYRGSLLSNLFSLNPMDLISPSAHAQASSLKKNTFF